MRERNERLRRQLHAKQQLIRALLVLLAVMTTVSTTLCAVCTSQHRALVEQRRTPESETLPTLQTIYYYSDEIPLDHFLQEVAQDACKANGVPYSLALAVIEQESAFNPEADNGLCYGLMQINRINYQWLRDIGIEPASYKGNIEAGVYMLGELLKKYGDVHKALMAYNCGETGAKRLWNNGQMTSAYSSSVVNLAQKWAQQVKEANA